MRRTANKEGDQGNAIVEGETWPSDVPIHTKVIQGYIKKDYVSKVFLF